MKLQFMPELDSYSVEEGDYRSFAEALNSPAPNVGKGFVNTPFAIPCKYILTEAEHKTFMDFFEAHMFGRSFEADLILDSSLIQECKCRFVYDSLKIANKGECYTINVILMSRAL